FDQEVRGKRDQTCRILDVEAGDVDFLRRESVHLVPASNPDPGDAAEEIASQFLERFSLGCPLPPSPRTIHSLQVPLNPRLVIRRHVTSPRGLAGCAAAGRSPRSSFPADAPRSPPPRW